MLQGHGEADRRLSPGVGGSGRSPLIRFLGRKRPSSFINRTLLYLQCRVQVQNSDTYIYNYIYNIQYTHICILYMYEGMSKCVYLQNSDAERNFSPEIVRLKVSFSSPMGHWPQPVYCLVVSPALEKRKYTIDSGNYDEPSLTTINMLLNSYSGMHKI